VQEPPDPRLLPQLPPPLPGVLRKEVGLAPLMLKLTANVPAPDGLVRVNVIVLLVEPRFTFPKLADVGVSVFTRPVKETLLPAPFKARFSVAV
jgi:hypothetical protein